MSRALNIVNEIPSNKAGIKLFAEALVTAVMDGHVEPLDLRVRIDAIEKIIKSVKDDVSFRDAIMDQADLYPEKSFEINGATFTKAETAKYDYSEDKQWAELKIKETNIVALRKARESLLKAIKEPTGMDGVTIYPPPKQSTSYVRVTL